MSSMHGEPAASVADRPWYGPARAMMTLLGVAVAGLLVWIATQMSSTTTGGYWAGYGVVAGAGLVLALSQLLGGWTKFGLPRLSASVFLFAFVPTLIVVGWIAVFDQPHGNWFRSHATSWSGDLGIEGFVRDLGDLLSVLALGLGVVLGYCFDTAGPRRPTVARPEAPAALDRRAVDEPLTAERTVVTQPPTDRDEPATTPAERASAESPRTAPEE